MTTTAPSREILVLAFRGLLAASLMVGSALLCRAQGSRSPSEEAVSVSSMAKDEALCKLQFLDDRGVPIEAELEVCPRAGGGCRIASFGEAPLEVKARRGLEVEGPRHGPVSDRPTLDLENPGRCMLRVPRKGRVTLTPGDAAVSAWEVSFYRAEEGRLEEPWRELDWERPSLRREKTADPGSAPRELGVRELWVPAGAYVVSFASRGRAPDLHGLEVEPGSRHRLQPAAREGASFVLRTVDLDGAPVRDVEIQLSPLPGFVGASRETATTRAFRVAIARGKTGTHGLALFSGIREPVVAAASSHPAFLEARLPALATDIGTFRYFEQQLYRGGSLRASVTLEQLPAASASCELLDFEAPGRGEQRRALRQAVTEPTGVCRMVGLAEGSYALRVVLPPEGAEAEWPVAIEEGRETELEADVHAIRIRGSVFRGEEPAVGFSARASRVSEDLSFSAETAASATVEDDGGFELTVWQAGRYVFKVNNRSTNAYVEILELHGDHEVDVQLAAEEIRGQVVDAEGSPVPSAQVSFRWGNQLRTVQVDEDARFEIPMVEAAGRAELAARATGYEASDPVRLRLEAGLEPPLLTLVLGARRDRTVLLFTGSGAPAAGAWVRAYRLPPHPMPRLVSQAVTGPDGEAELAVGSAGTLRLYFGGGGCPLGFRDVEILDDEAHWGIYCPEGGHALVRLVGGQPEVTDGAELLLAHEGVAIPRDAIRAHARALGLPHRTDGQGRLALVALFPGRWHLYHGAFNSELGIEGGRAVGYLTSLDLRPRQTSEVEVELSLQPRSGAWLEPGPWRPKLGWP